MTSRSALPNRERAKLLEFGAGTGRLKAPARLIMILCQCSNYS